MTEQKLKEIFYNPTSGYIGVEKLLEKAQEIDPNIKRTTVENFYDKQEVNQLNKKVTNVKFFEIVSPDLCFNADHMFIPKALKSESETRTKNSQYFVFLLLVDILSRKAYVYHIPNKNQESTLTAFNKFLEDLKKDIDPLKGTPNEFARDQPLKITADKAFEFDKFTNLLKEKNILLDTQTAKDDHITKGNRLAIIDRLTRTIKNILMRYVYSHRHYSIPEVVEAIVNNYNDTDHESLGGSPNQLFQSKELRFKLYQSKVEHNRALQQTLGQMYQIGDRVRIIDEEASNWDKERPLFSKTIYKIKDMKGNKYQVEEEDGTVHRRLIKHHELQKVFDVEKPSDDLNDDISKRIKKEQKEIKKEKQFKQDDILEKNIVTGPRKKKFIKYI